MAQNQMRKSEPLRIVLVGMTGVGKSAAGNTILGKKRFKSIFSCGSVTQECEKKRVEVNGRDVFVVDTPGLFDTIQPNEITLKEVVKCICLSSPGPHIFLVVIELGRFTTQEQDTVKLIVDTFGKESSKYTMVLFTHGDELEETPIEEFINKNEQLSAFTDQCHGGCHVFNNKDLKNRSQVIELLQKIVDRVTVNGGSCYTSEMYQRAEKAIETRKAEILIETEEERKKELEELEKQIKDKAEKEKAKAREDLRKKQDEEARIKAELDNAFIVECLKNGAIGGCITGIIGGAVAGAVIAGPLGAIAGACMAAAGGGGVGAGAGAAVGAAVVKKDNCTTQ